MKSVASITFVLIILAIRLFFLIKTNQQKPKRDSRTGEIIDFQNPELPAATTYDQPVWIAPVGILGLVMWVSVSTVAMLIYPRNARWEQPWVAYCYYTGTLLIVISSVGYGVHRIRWKKKASDENFELCPECGYNLRGMPIKHVCPECGKPYDLYQVKLKWHKALKPPK